MSAAAASLARAPAFVHDLNACVGCHACAIACINEHALPPGRFWRQVATFNPERRPALNTYHLSLACNHCLDAPCERGCPALAIARDARTGAVLIDAASCIGCHYCSWVCPYDAPKYDATLGIMQKCTFCAHRLAEGLLPACVAQCPTGALRLGAYDERAHRDVGGLPQVGVRPAISVVPLRAKAARGVDVAEWAQTAEAGATGCDVAASPLSGPAPKISFASEWALAVFTWLCAVLVAWQAASLLGGPRVRGLPLLGLAAGAIAVSTTHLGRPRRAMRAALNWRHSWLSREVIAFSGFAASAAVASVLPAAAPSAVVATRVLSLAAVAAGVALVFSIDRVYASTATRRLHVIDRAAALTSAAFLTGVFSGTPWLLVGAGALRLEVAAVRVLASHGRRSGARLPRAALRVLLGLGVPCALWLAGGNVVVAAALATIGEFLDRADFYDGMEVVTPTSAMRDALRAAMVSADRR